MQVIAPSLINTIREDLQKLVGPSPILECFPLHLTACPGKTSLNIRAQPKTYSEIARVIRASRHLKMVVRAVGGCTGGDLNYYITPVSVIIDLSNLGEQPRIKFVQFPEINKDGEEEELTGLRILAGVTFDELSEFLVASNIEVAQYPDVYSLHSTVVGAVTACVPGIAGPNSAAQGACLTDEVLAITIVNSDGDLIEYTGDDLLSCAAGSMGLLGVVYSVTIRYRPLTLTKVNYQFIPWSDLLDTSNELLENAIATNLFTEITYLPYNSMNTDTGTDGWSGMKDEVLLRTGVQLGVAGSPECMDFIIPTQYRLRMLDETHGPNVSEFIAAPQKIPQLLRRAHNHLKERYSIDPIVIQFTPWALDSMERIRDPVHFLKLTFKTTLDLKEFHQVINRIHKYFDDAIKLAHPKYPLGRVYNFGVRVHFTGPAKFAQALGFELKQNDPETILVHISMCGLVNPEYLGGRPTELYDLIQDVYDMNPYCVVQWKSDWPMDNLLTDRYRDLLQPHLSPLRNLMFKADEDGMFLNVRLFDVFMPIYTEYQENYHWRRAQYLQSRGVEVDLETDDPHVEDDAVDGKRK